MNTRRNQPNHEKPCMLCQESDSVHNKQRKNCTEVVKRHVIFYTQTI